MTILSIDFDICMWKDIELYNSLVNSFNTVDNVIKDYPLLQGVRFDADIYNRLTGLIVKIARRLPVNKIHFISTHEDIVPLFQNGKCNNEVINIDHHHDLGYSQAPDKWNSAGCANWVKFLYQNNMIEKYTHIGDSLSVRPFPEDAPLVTEFIDINSNGIDHLVDIVDELCICLSPAWVPQQYHGLFEAWATTLSVIKNTKYKYK